MARWWWPILIALVVVGIEIAVRLDDWSRYGTPVTGSATDISDLIMRDRDGLHARPGAVYKFFRIDSLGFRGPDRSRAALQRAPRIITTGASETFGLYEPRDQEWPRQLERGLSPLSPSPVVLNAAFAGMTLPTVTQDIQGRLARFAPAIVVYYPTPAQYLDRHLPDAARPDSLGPEPVPVFRWRAINRVRDAVKNAVPEPLLDLLRQRETERARRREPGNASAEETSASVIATAAARGERLDAFTADLRRLVGTVRAIGAQPVLVVHAHRFRDTTSVNEARLLRAWNKFYPHVRTMDLLVFDSLAAEATRAVARDSGALVIDPRPALRAVATPPFADHTHFTGEGAAIVARAVADSLRSRLLTPR